MKPSERREPTPDQITAAALCVSEAYGVALRDARRAVVHTHAALAGDWREPYWAWTGR